MMKCTYFYIKITLIQVELRPFSQIFIKFNSKQNSSKLYQALFPYEILGKCLHLIGCAGHLTKIQPFQVHKGEVNLMHWAKGKAMPQCIKFT